MNKILSLKRFLLILVVVMLSILLLVKLLSFVHREQEVIIAPYQITLTSHEGKPVNLDEFSNKPKLVFFGFTHCPTICPIAVANISTAIELMGAEADKFHFLFITTDPERDNPEAMKAYLQPFAKNITGLTGDMVNLQKAYDKYHVFS